MGETKAEIICAACKQETFIRREPIYDGFRKVGNKLICVTCGHVYTDESDVPYKPNQKNAIFTDADRTQKISIFKSDEAGRNCRHCRHYVVNPFMQRCGLHQREVQATDLCNDFSPAQTDKQTTKDPLSSLFS